VKSVIPIISVSVFLVISALSQSLAAEDASIDKLLSKLPPPEKLVKPSVQKAVTTIGSGV